MIETAMTKEALTYVKEYYGDRKDECGKPIIERLLWIAERMEDEITACTALLQDFMYERLREWPSLSTGIPSPVFHAMNTLFYPENREPYDSYIRHVLTDEVAAKVKIVDLQYRSDPSNYPELTTETIDRILMYRSAYWQMFFHKIGREEENLQYDEMNAVKTSCCQHIVPKGTRFCPSCGKKIDNSTAEQLRYGFDKFATGMECWCCGAWMPAIYRYCGRCGEDLHHPRKTGSTIWEDQKDEN